MIDMCVCCGEIIPEGRMVCPKCENKPSKNSVAGLSENEIYKKAVARLERQGIKDPTAQIIALEKEIDYYRAKIRGMQERTAAGADPLAPGCEYCAGESKLYQYTYNTKLYIDTLGLGRTIITECMPCPPYAPCSMKGIPARSAFIINYCPNCGRKLSKEVAGHD